MSLKRTLAIFFSIIVVAGSSLSYEIETHEQIAWSAFDATQISTQQEILYALGLWSLEQKFPSSQDHLLDIRTLVGFGAKHEDDGSRPLRHFYDPVNERGLNVSILEWDSSPDWALQDNGVVTDAEQKFSYQDAVDNYIEALTTANPYIYRQKMGITFQSLGQIIHHLQDMAQPEHVRNDPHLVVPLPNENKLPLDPSLYEDITNNLSLTGKLQEKLQGQYPHVSFSLPRHYWNSKSSPIGGQKGIAEFTNSNFVSKDSNFQLQKGEVVTGEYNLPQPLLPSESESLSELLGDKGATLCDRLKNDRRIIAPQETVCSVEFISSQVTDRYTGTTEFNPRAASISVLDQHLEARGVGGFTRRAGKVQVKIDRLLTLNRFNFEKFHEFLLPRAVAYSTGLINHFFRGRLEISPPDAGIYSAVDHSDLEATEFKKIRLKLKNSSSVPGKDGEETPDLSGGTLRAVVRYLTNPCYKGDLSGEVNMDLEFPANDCDYFRYYSEAEPGIAVSAPVAVASVGDSFTDYTFDFSASPVPIGVRDVILQVVYQGKVGEEEDGIAVGTRNISEPTYLTLFNNTDYYGIDGTLYTPEQIRQDPALLERVDPNGDGEPDYNIDPEPLSNVRFAVNGTLLTETATLELHDYTRIALLADLGDSPGSKPIQVEVGLDISQGGLQLLSTYVSPTTNQLQRQPIALSPLKPARGIYQRSMIWFSKQLGTTSAPGKAIFALPTLEEIPDPTPLSVTF